MGRSSAMWARQSRQRCTTPAHGGRRPLVTTVSYYCSSSLHKTPYQVYLASNYTGLFPIIFPIKKELDRPKIEIRCIHASVGSVGHASNLYPSSVTTMTTPDDIVLEDKKAAAKGEDETKAAEEVAEEEEEVDHQQRHRRCRRRPPPPPAAAAAASTLIANFAIARFPSRRSSGA